MECLIYNPVKQRILTDTEVKRLARKILTRFKSLNKSLSIQFVGEKKIRELNKKYRGVDKVTDVLSFGLEEEDLGDIFICYAQIKKQAKFFQVTAKEEMARMLTHGVLHLLGFEHENKKQERKMFKEQEKLVKKFL